MRCVRELIRRICPPRRRCFEAHETGWRAACFLLLFWDEEESESFDARVKLLFDQTIVEHRELRSGSRRQAVSELRRSLYVHLYREVGIPLAEIARLVGIGTSGVAMAVKGLDEKTKLNEMNAVPEKSSTGLNSSRKRGYLKSDPAVRPGRKD